MSELQTTIHRTSWTARQRGGSFAKRVAAHQGLLLIASLFVSLIIASAWLVFPYLVEGRGILSDVGASVQGERRANALNVAQFLTRYADGPGDADVEVLYATPKYFEVADNPRAVLDYRPDRNFVFLVNESTHIEDLPPTLPVVTLTVDGVVHEPFDVVGPEDAGHHRMTIVRFAHFDVSQAAEFAIALSNNWDRENTTRSVSWTTPIDYPADLIAGGLWTPIMLLALSAGLLSAVMTPCLLQMVVIYMATLTGLSAADVTQPGAVDGSASRRMFKVALAFVVGFIIVYTIAGAAIGFAAREAQMLFAEGSRLVGIVSGILIIALGLWAGVKARAPLVCKIPLPRTIAMFDKAGTFRSALMAGGFSLGCTACFGGAIIATLLVYVGSLGSATVGAAVMFMFSIGIAVPFLAAAVFLSRATSLMARIQQYGPMIGLLSTTIIVAFGLVLITDNFHMLSNLIYPWLGLG